MIGLCAVRVDFILFRHTRKSAVIATVTLSYDFLNTAPLRSKLNSNVPGDLFYFSKIHFM